MAFFSFWVGHIMLHYKPIIKQLNYVVNDYSGHIIPIIMQIVIIFNLARQIDEWTKTLNLKYDFKCYNQFFNLHCTN